MNERREFLVDYMLAIGLVLLGWLIVMGVSWRLGYFHLSPVRAEPQVSGYLVFFAFALLLVGFLVVVPLTLVIYQLVTIGKVIPGAQVDPLFFLYLSFVAYLLILASIVAVIRGVLGSQETLRLCLGPKKGGKRRFLRDAVLGLVSWPLAIVPLSLIHQGLTYLVKEINPQAFGDQLAIKQLKQSLELGSPGLLTAFAMILIIPILEELLFRGLLQSWMRIYLARSWAIICSSLLFACAHFSFEQHLANVPLLGALFILSCFLGFVYERQQSLIAPVALHSLFNFLTVGTVILNKLLEN